MTVDPETGAVRVRVSDGTVVDTIEVHPCVALDLDDRRMVVGIEFLPKDAARQVGDQFARPEDEARWKERKRFMDDGWEGPSGDFSQTDLIDAAKVELDSPETKIRSVVDCLHASCAREPKPKKPAPANRSGQ